MTLADLFTEPTPRVYRECFPRRRTWNWRPWVKPAAEAAAWIAFLSALIWLMGIPMPTP